MKFWLNLAVLRDLVSQVSGMDPEKVGPFLLDSDSIPIVAQLDRQDVATAMHAAGVRFGVAPDGFEFDLDDLLEEVRKFTPDPPDPIAAIKGLEAKILEVEEHPSPDERKRLLAELFDIVHASSLGRQEARRTARPTG